MGEFVIFAAIWRDQHIFAKFSNFAPNRVEIEKKKSLGDECAITYDGCDIGATIAGDERDGKRWEDDKK